MLNASHFPISLPEKSQLPQSANFSPLYSVILKNHPKDPNERKTFIDKVGPNPNDITEFCRSNDESKQTAGQIVENVKRTEPSLIISLKEPAFVTAIKRVPEDLAELLQKQLIPRCTKAVQCDKFRIFKVYFPS